MVWEPLSSSSARKQTGSPTASIIDVGTDITAVGSPMDVDRSAAGSIISFSSSQEPGSVSKREGKKRPFGKIV